MPAILATIALLAAGVFASLPATFAADPERPEDEMSATEPEEVGELEIIEQILLLERRIEELSGLLSPAAREELEGRLQEVRALEDETAAEARAERPAPSTEPGEEARSDDATPASADGSPVAATTERDAELSAAEAPTAPRGAVGAPPRCAPLLPFDSSDDGVLAATDRSWRFFSVWIDHDRDGSPDEPELQHPFELGIVEISLGLLSFRTRDDFTGDIRRADLVYLEPLGRSSSTGALMVDATRLRQGGGPTLLDPEGEELEGLQALRPGLRLRDDAGAVTPLDCP